MAENSKIEWTDHTFNPWVGCTKVSPACDHCYAESWAKRAGKAAGVAWGGERRRTSESTWRQPLKWNAQAQAEGRRYRVFCASLADVFDNQVPTGWRVELLATIGACEHLDWLLLTKRVGNVTRLLCEAAEFAHAHGMPAVAHWITAWVDGEPPPNVWLGATVCNQAEADRDVPKLLATPAAVRFLSVEPMLGPINLTRIDVQQGDAEIYPLTGTTECVNDEGEPVSDIPPLSWVICGGESGPGARPMSPDWARSLRDQCARAGVPFLFKQWGEWLPMLGQAEGIAVRGEKATTFDGWVMGWAGKKAAGRHLDGVTHDGFPGVVA